MVAWRDIGPATLPPARALGRLEAVLGAMKPGDPPVVSWCDLAESALIVGRSASAPPVDWSACERLGLPVHRRASGGGAVLWDAGLIAFDVVLPVDHVLLGADVVAAYRWVGDAVRRALADGGVRADLVDLERARADHPDAVLAMACFGGLSPWELTVEGKKLVGLSQVRRRSGGAFQVGIPIRFDAVTLAEALAVDARSFAGALGNRVTDIAGMAPELSRESLIGYLRRHLADAFGVAGVASDLSPVELKREKTASVNVYSALTGAGG